MKTLFVRLVLGFAAVSAFTQSVSAQQLIVHGGIVDANHPLTIKPMYGGDLTVALPFGDSRVGARFTLGYHAGSSDERMGTLCTGLIFPGQDCSPERLDDRFSLFASSGGIYGDVVKASNIRLSVLGNLQLARVVSSASSVRTGSRLDANRGLWGPSAGINLSWLPVSSGPWSLELRAIRGFLTPIGENLVLDGYTPFDYNSGISTTSISLGVGLRIPRRNQ